MKNALMGHLIQDCLPLELYAWIDPDTESPGRDVLTDTAFGEPQPGEVFDTVRNYFAEYHLEFYRQRWYGNFPSRLHALLLFATRTDAENFRMKYPNRVFGKFLVCTHSLGDYTVSFHDASWLDYLCLPHSLSLATLNEISNHYWKGQLVEEMGLDFMGQPWQETPIIEALFQGKLEKYDSPQSSCCLPGFS